ncbi:MAG: DUF1211 domain-containing protein [Flavobacteriales bacterium]|nr:DUF1211 domain-containing protein [Flavobacteriales bacterium]
MLSKKFKRSQKVSKTGFRYRGLTSSRLENLIDAVFGFSITLLVIASEVPRDYVELQASMYSFSGFIFCILLLLSIWNNQNNFFLHYGLQDETIKILTFLFLFLLLFYIYPLKYLFSYLGTAIYAQIMIGFGDKSEALVMAVDKLNESALSEAEWRDIMIRFGLGLFLIYALLALMHLHALRKKKELELNSLEEFETGTAIRSYIILMIIAFSSILVVAIFGGVGAVYAGSIYGAIPLFLILLKKKRIQKFRKLTKTD